MNRTSFRRVQRGGFFLSLLMVLSMLMPFLATAMAADTIPVTGIEGVPLAMAVGESVDFSAAVVTPGNATHSEIVWSLSDGGETDVGFADGILTADAPGKVTLTATVTNGLAKGKDYTADFVVEVTAVAPDPFVPVTGIEGVPLVMVMGESVDFSAAATAPGNTTHSEIVWNLGDSGETGAGLVDGILTADAPGKVTLTATVANGLAKGEDYTEHFIIPVLWNEGVTPLEVSKIPAESWDGSGDAEFTVGEDDSEFLFITRDGVLLPEEDYTHAHGSTVITLKEEYLKTLESGLLKLRAEFTTGYAWLELQIETDAGENPPSDPAGSITGTLSGGGTSSGGGRLRSAGNPPAYADAFRMTADTDTNGDATADSYQDIFTDSSNDDGRIWTDKSVKTDAVAGGFEITLSALAQAVQVRQQDIIPSDTVFILDVSTSMTQKMDVSSGSRIAEMVKALNGIIGDLMDNPDNRVAVVAFGGDRTTPQRARGEQVLALDHYDDDDGDGYFKLITPTYVEVDDEILDSDIRITGGGRLLQVKGGTPTQWGIYEAAQVFLEEHETKYTDPLSGNTYIRKPNIVLLTDGEPTFGWSDYRFDTPPTLVNFSSGNANDVDMGPEILTVLSASYFKQLISEHYYDDGSQNKAGFYTIGLGVGDSDDARATMNPADKTQNGEGEQINADLISYRLGTTTYNMRHALDSFVLAGSATFPTLDWVAAGSGQIYHKLITVGNRAGKLKSPLTSYNYADYYGVADDAGELQDQFDEVSRVLTTESSYVTSVVSDPTNMYNDTGTSYADYSGAVVFSDVLGEHMEFKSFRHLLFRDKQYNGAMFASRMLTENQGGNLTAPHGPTTSKAINALFSTQLFYSEIATPNGGTMDYDDLTREMEGLIASSLAAQDGRENPDEYGIYYHSATDFGNRIRYYADEESSWVGNYFTSGGIPVTIPPPNAACLIDVYFVSGATTNNVSGNPSDLTYSVFQVITALGEAEVNEVNFRVSGSYIEPLPVVTRTLAAGQQMTRWIIPASLLPLRSVVGGLLEEAPPPIRFVYTVGLKSDLTESETPQGAAFYANDRGNNEKVALAHFVPGPDNRFYDTLPEPGLPLAKSGGDSTNTGGNATERRDIGGSPVRGYNLRNNGRMEIPYGDLTVTKTWDSQVIQSEVFVQLYLNGNPVNSPVPISIGDDTAAWNNLRLFELSADSAGRTVPLHYTIAEGKMNGSDFVPFGAGMDYKVDYLQPSLNDADTGYNAEIVNSAPGAKNWIVNIEKAFEVNGIPISPAEAAAMLGNQNVRFLLFAKQTFLNGSEPEERFLQIPLQEFGANHLSNDPMLYPDNFANGQRSIWVAETAQGSPDKTDFLFIEIMDETTNFGDYEYADPDVTVEGVAAVPVPNDQLGDDGSILFWGSLDLVNGVPTGGMIPFDWEDTFHTSVGNLRAYRIDNVPDGGTATFKLTNNLVLKEKPVATLRLLKDVQGIDEDNFAAHFEIEGWRSETGVQTRDLADRVYYRTVDYAEFTDSDGDGIKDKLLYELPLPGAGSGENYYYTVTESAAGSIKKDTMSIFERNLHLQSMNGGSIADDDADDDTVGFTLDENTPDATVVSVHLNNVYNRVSAYHGEIILQKRLAGNYPVWGITDNTQFMARIKNIETEEYLVFDKEGVLTATSPKAGFGVSFSGGSPAVLTGIPPGIYEVEEQPCGAAANYDVNGTGTNQVTIADDATSVTVTVTLTVTNTYSGNPPSNPDLPQTGDDNNSNRWLVMLLFSVFGVVFLLKWRTRQRKKGTW